MSGERIEGRCLFFTLESFVELTERLRQCVVNYNLSCCASNIALIIYIGLTLKMLRSYSRLIHNKTIINAAVCLLNSVVFKFQNDLTLPSIVGVRTNTLCYLHQCKLLHWVCQWQVYTKMASKLITSLNCGTTWYSDVYRHWVRATRTTPSPEKFYPQPQPPPKKQTLVLLFLLPSLVPLVLVFLPVVDARLHVRRRWRRHLYIEPYQPTHTLYAVFA